MDYYITDTLDFYQKEFQYNGIQYRRLDISEFEHGYYTSSSPNTLIESANYSISTNKLDSNIIIFNPNNYKVAVIAYKLDNDDTWVGYKTPEGNVISNNFINNKIISIKRGSVKYRLRIDIYNTNKVYPENIFVFVEKYDNSNIQNSNFKLKFNYGNYTKANTTYYTNSTFCSQWFTVSKAKYYRIKSLDTALTFYIVIEDLNTGNVDYSNGSDTVQNTVILLKPSCRYKIRTSGKTQFTHIEDDPYVIEKMFSIEEETFYSFKRELTNITDSLTFERKSITSAGITDSNVEVMCKLPDKGSIFIKLNNASGRFAPYIMQSNGSIVMPSNYSTWCNHTYQYTGNTDNKWYARIGWHDSSNTSDLSLSIAEKIIHVYNVSYSGCKTDYNGALYGKSIAIIGDSIVQGRYAKNDNSSLICMDKPFSDLIAEKVNYMGLCNYGIGGALVYNNDWKSLSRHYTKISDYDCVFIVAGTNDFGGNISIEDFSSAYSTIVTWLKNNNTEVVLVSPCHRTNKSTNSLSLTLIDYANAIETIAQSQSCKYINLNTLTDNDFFDSHLSDGLHPDEVDHAIIADILLDQYDLLS